MTILRNGKGSFVTDHFAPAPRQVKHSTDVWVSLSIALLLGLIAVSIALWPAEQSPTASPAGTGISWPSGQSRYSSFLCATNDVKPGARSIRKRCADTLRMRAPPLAVTNNLGNLYRPGALALCRLINPERDPLLKWPVVRALLLAGLGIGALVQSIDAQVPRYCSERLLVKLTPDVPNPKAPSFLDSLSADPLYHLSWVRSTQDSVVLDLTGPAPQYRCHSEVRRIRRDGRVVWLKVLRKH